MDEKTLQLVKKANRLGFINQARLLKPELSNEALVDHLHRAETIEKNAFARMENFKKLTLTHLRGDQKPAEAAA